MFKVAAVPGVSPTAVAAAAQPVEPVRDVLDDFPLSSVIRLSNMCSRADLTDNELYDELLEDVADECNTHGTVKSIVIPRGLDGAPDDESVVRTNAPYISTYTHTFIHTYILTNSSIHTYIHTYIYEHTSMQHAI